MSTEDEVEGQQFREPMEGDAELGGDEMEGQQLREPMEGDAESGGDEMEGHQFREPAMEEPAAPIE